MTTPPKHSAAALRRQAEKIARSNAARTPAKVAALPPAAARRTLHELQVHQIELELQNEELRTAQAELDAARARYFDLYNMAPVGYLTVSEQGLILEANLTAATLLGTARSALVKKSFSRFILKEDQDIYYRHHQQLFATGAARGFELRMVKKGGAAFWARLDATAAPDADGAPVCRVTLSDISANKEAEAVRRASDEWHRTVLRATMDGFWLADTQGRLREVNASFCRMSGYREAELLGMCFSDFIDSETQAETAAHIHQVITQGGDCFEARFHRKDGSVLYVDISVQYQAGAGADGLLTVFLHDITARKRAAEVLRESEERLRDVLENALDAAYKYNLQTNTYEYLSPVFTQLTGYAPDEIQAWPTAAVLDFIHADDRADVARVLAESMAPAAAATACQLEYRFKRKDGQYRWFQDRFTITRDAAGQPVGRIGNVSDITERRQAEAALRESEASRREQVALTHGHHANALYARQLLEASPDPLTVISPAGLITDVNLATEQVTGLGRHKLIGTHFADYFTDPERAQVGYREVLAKGYITDYPLAMRNANGTCTDVLYNAAVYRNELGQICGVFAAGRDITAHQRAEADLRASESKYRALVETTGTGYLILDKHGRVLDANPEYVRMSGHATLGDILGKSVAEWTAADAQPHNAAAVAECVKNGVIRNLVVDYVAANGRTTPVEINATVEGAGAALRIVLLCRDITARKQAEDDLQRVKTAVDAVSDAIGIATADGHHFYQNAAFDRLFGYSLQEITELQPARIYANAADATLVFDTIMAGSSWQGEVEMIAKNGRHFPVSLRADAVKDAHGKLIGLIGVHTDITERKRAEEALRQTSARLALAAQAGGVGIWDYDVVSNRLDWDDQMFRLYGVTREQCRDANAVWQAGLHPDDRQRGDEELLMALRGEKDLDTEVRVRWPDGTIHNIRAMALVQRDATGQPLHMIGTHWDITAQKQVEESLHQTSTRLALAAQAGRVGIWDHDVVNDVLVWDDQMCRLYGITPAQFSGTNATWQAALHPDDRPRGEEEVQQALRGDKEYDTEFRVRWPDGTIHNIRAMAQVQRDATGRPLHLVGTNWDITAQKQTLEALRQSEETLRIHIESSFDIIFTLTSDGIFDFVSPAWQRHFGHAPGAVQGQPFARFVHPDDVAPLAAYLQRVLHSGQGATSPEYRVRHVNGAWLWLVANGAPYRSPHGARQFIGVGRDITESKRIVEALRESEANFRTFFETMTDMIMVGTPEGRILYTNAAVTRTLGYRAEELTGMQILDLHPADKRGEAADTFAAMFRGERDSCPLPLAAKRGALVPVETRVWFGTWNGAHCLFGICKNLSVEQEATQRFERLFRSNPNLMALSSLPDRRFTDVNDAFLTTLGYAMADILGKTAAELDVFVQPAHQAALADQLQAAGHINDFELQIRRKDGVVLDGLFSGEVISSQGRQYLLTVMTDITARKRTETELARLSVIQRALMQLATHFVNVPLEQQDAAIDHSLATIGQLTQVDRAYLFAYDFAAGIMVNTHEWCARGITPEIGNLQAVPMALLPDWVAAHQRGESVHLPCVTALPVGSNTRRILEPQGIRSLITLPLMQGTACLGFVGFDAVRDERAWRDDEVALLRVLAELYAHFEARRAAERATRALQQHLTEARDAAQAAARAKSLFLANMSHEIRTPLNAILGYAQIMERECRPCPAKQRLSAITRSGDHLLALITDLLELVRSDARTITLAPGIFDFHQLLEDVRVMFVQRPEAQTLTLTAAHTANVPRMLCADQGKLRQILLNLVGNAVKFTAQGSVHMAASLLGGGAPGSITLAIDVEDTGCGIQPDELAHVFDLFYLAEHGRQTGTGTGLGLPLSQRYARALGGDISVTSQLGVGSRFRLTFMAELVRSSAQPAQRGSVLRLAADQRAGRILAVDDDPASCAMLAAMLTPVGFAVETAGSAAQALQCLRHAPDVAIVLLDKCMPEMDGYEAIGRMRELAGGHAFAIVVVTASGFADERAQALAAGADGFVTKPVLRERLLEEIGRAAGIQYEYEPVVPAAPEPALLEPAALAQLPAGSRRMLDHALRRGDVRLLRSTVAALAPEHAGLAAALLALIDTYDYDRLRSLLDSSKGTDP